MKQKEGLELGGFEKVSRKLELVL